MAANGVLVLGHENCSLRLFETLTCRPRTVCCLNSLAMMSAPREFLKAWRAGFTFVADTFPSWFQCGQGGMRSQNHHCFGVQSDVMCTEGVTFIWVIFLDKDVMRASELSSKTCCQLWEVLQHATSLKRIRFACSQRTESATHQHTNGHNVLNVHLFIVESSDGCVHRT